MAQRGFLVIDANVLVDYQAADLAILELVNRHVGTVHILTTMLEEVEGLDESDCERLGFRVVEPTFVQVVEAASQTGRLSFQDRTCLVVCRDRGWTCVSNDRALRRACEADGIGVIWGLELMLELVRHGDLLANDASEAAERIHLANPVYVNSAILAAFRAKLAGLA